MSRAKGGADTLSCQVIDNVEPMTGMTGYDTEIPIDPYTRVRAHAPAHGTASIGKQVSYPVIPCHSPTPHPLLDLAKRVSRLGPDRRNPEQFHIDKSEIVAELRRLARKKDAGR